MDVTASASASMDENERRGVEGYILKLELATEVGRRGDPARHGPCDQLDS